MSSSLHIEDSENSNVLATIFGDICVGAGKNAYILQGDKWRISILTDALARFEWSENGEFCDLPTLTVVNRNFDYSPEVHVSTDDQAIEISTNNLRIQYNGGQFTPYGLKATIKNVRSGNNTWHYGDIDYGNLKGTTRTLDTVDGSTELQNGILSRDGWAILDDSSNICLEPRNDIEYNAWISANHKHDIDIYLFGYGHDYLRAVKDFYRLTGSTPLLPRYALGNWWSRYHQYTQQEYETLMQRFSEERIPFSVAVIDMDWHLVDSVDPKFGSGWTGYTWNTDLFSNPERFLENLHGKGLHTALNLHPRDGIRAFEKTYHDLARALNFDDSREEAIEFDGSSHKFMKAYFDKVLHPMEDEGVDFWWVDWQQGSVSNVPGLDPLWMLNAVHYGDNTKNAKAGLTFSRYAGPGSHRYPVGFSGDTVVSWKSLAFQPYFTATASNIGYGWWSHDIGGHMHGVRDEELQARWYQLGVFSPINRLHSAVSPFTGKEPWNFHEPVKTSMIEALRLRYKLLPYLYSMNYKASYDGVPLVQPLYWYYSEEEEAYNHRNQYFFGNKMLVAPITEPIDRSSLRAHSDVWLPSGSWFDFFSGRKYTSVNGDVFSVWRGIDQVPVFASAGSLIPIQREDERGVFTDANPENMTLIVFPENNGSFDMVEDDNAGNVAVTKCALKYSEDSTKRAEITIRSEGNISCIPEKRGWQIILRGIHPIFDQDIKVYCSSDESELEEIPVDMHYDDDTLSLVIDILEPVGNSDLTIKITGELCAAENPVGRDILDLLMDAQIGYDAKDYAYQILMKQGIRALSTLQMIPVRADAGEEIQSQVGLPQSLISAITEIYTRS